MPHKGIVKIKGAWTLNIVAVWGNQVFIFVYIYDLIKSN